MRALSFLWGEEFCIKKCKCFLLIAHDAVYIYIYYCVLFFGHIQSYTEFHIIQVYFLPEHMNKRKQIHQLCVQQTFIFFACLTHI